MKQISDSGFSAYVDESFTKKSLSSGDRKLSFRDIESNASRKGSADPESEETFNFTSIFGIKNNNVGNGNDTPRS